MMTDCRKWCGSESILIDYHDNEWCKVNHDECFEFEMMCLESASVGLSWKIIMHRREAYNLAFHNFDIDACASMTDEELEALLTDSGIIRHRGKIFSVRTNAQAVQRIQKEFGSLDAYLWSFTKGKQIDNKCQSLSDIPTVNDISKKMSADMKRRGISFMGPVITYSFMQAIGMVNDHLLDCDCREPMNIEVRKCTTDDIDTLRPFSIQTYFETFASMNTPENMEAYLKEAFDREKLLAELADVNSTFYILYLDGALAGYLKLNESPSQTDINDACSLEIERIYVSSKYQGRGLGQYLMDMAIGIAEREHKRYVWLGVWEKNEKALGFYRKNGFVPIATHSFFMGDDEQTDFIMRKNI